MNDTNCCFSEMDAHKDPPTGACTEKKTYDPGKPLNFTISINEEEWEKVKPTMTIRSDRTTLVLQPGWTDLVLDKIWLQYPLACSFPMHSHKFFTRPGFPYLKFEGRCNECKAPIVGKIIQKPDQFPYVVQIETFNTSGIVHTRMRQLRHQKRIDVREQVRHLKPLKFRHLQANDHLDDDGNMKHDSSSRPDLNSTVVINKLRQEVKKNDTAEYSDDVVSALIELTMKFPDYFRSFSTIPVVIRYWSNNQMKLWNKVAPLGYSVSIDASGKFTQRLNIIDGQKSSAIFFYNVTVRIKKKIYTLAQMLSSAHDVGEIASWLSAWIKAGALVPKEAVVDCALALLISLCMNFNHCTYVEYLDWNLSVLLGLSDVMPQCNIKRDRAHLIKASSSWTCFKNDNWTKKDMYLRVISFSLEIEVLEELKKVVIALFIVSQSQHQSSLYLRSFQFLEGKISTFDHQKFNNGDNEDCKNCEQKNCPILQETDCSIDGDDQLNNCTARQYILGLKAKADEQLRKPEAHDSNVPNSYYLKSISSNLVTLYTQFTAWTNVMHPFHKFGPKTVSTSTNSEVYYRIHRREYGFSSPVSLKMFVLEEKPLIEGATKLGLRVLNQSLGKLKVEKAEQTIAVEKPIREITNLENETVNNDKLLVKQTHILQGNGYNICISIVMFTELYINISAGKENRTNNDLKSISNSTEAMMTRIFSINLTSCKYLMTVIEYRFILRYLSETKVTLTVEDYQSLKVPNYVSGNIIDIFMSIQLQTAWKNIDVIPTSHTVFMVGDQWNGKHGEDWELYHLKHELKDIIYIPYCFDFHWCLIIMNNVEGTLLHLDPLFINPQKRHDYKRAFQNFLDNCSASNTFAKKYWRWVDDNLNLVKQKDGYNCGPTVMYYMMEYANAGCRSASTSFDPIAYRLEIAKLLLTWKNTSNDICLYCFNASKTRYEKGISKCQNCNRWAHKGCINRNNTKLVLTKEYPLGYCEFCL